MSSKVSILTSEWICRGLRMHTLRRQKKNTNITSNKKVVFRLGYQSNAPSLAFEVRDICFGYGKEEWGAPPDKQVFIIKLGKRIII